MSKSYSISFVSFFNSIEGAFFKSEDEKSKHLHAIDDFSNSVHGARKGTFHELDLQAGVVAAALLGILVGAGHEYGNKVLEIKNLFVDISGLIETKSIQDYALFNAVPFVFFFVLQIFGLILKFGIISSDQSRVLKVRTRFAKGEIDWDEALNQMRKIARAKFLSLYNLSRLMYSAAYFPWALGLLLFGNAIVDYVGWWTH